MEEGKKYRQFLVAVVSNISSIACGCVIGWSSPAFSKLNPIDGNLNDSPLNYIPDSNSLSWIGALFPLGALIGPHIAGPLTDRIGRKWTLLSSSVFFISSYILLATTKSVTQIYIARILQGFGVGFVMTTQTMYIGEISTDDCRGALGSFMQLAIAIGITFVYCVGPYTSFIVYQIICLTIPILFVILFFFMPDSPHFYIAKGRKEEAEESLMFLRDKSVEGVQDELERIESDVQELMKQKGTLSDIFKSKANTRALIISAGIASFQQLSGINVVIFYSQKIFETAGSKLEPAIATIIIGAVQILASALTPLVVERLGRKVIFLFSAGGMAICLGLLGLFFLLDEQEFPIASSLNWLPIVSLIGFVVVYCVGFGPLPWALFGELFAPDVKSSASSIVTSMNWTLGFLLTKYFLALQEVLGSYGAFWLFGIFCIAAFIFTFTLVFETKGLSLQQIQDKLNGR